MSIIIIITPPPPPPGGRIANPPPEESVVDFRELHKILDTAERDHAKVTVVTT